MASLTILEPHCSGHRMQYVRWIAQEALSRGHRVNLVTLSSCLDHPLYLVMQRECGGRIRTTVFPHSEHLNSEAWLEGQGTVGLVRREFIYYRLFSTYFRGLCNEERSDLIFVPYLDYCAHAVGLLGSPFGSAPWGGIVLRPSFHFAYVSVEGPVSKLHPFKKRLFFRMLGNKRLRRLFTIDETLVRYVDQNKPSLSGKLRFVPDPVQINGTQSRAQARQRLGISNDAVVLLVYGALSLRKGVDALLSAAQQSDFPSEVVILLAGRQDKEVRHLLASPQGAALRESGRLHELDRFLSDEEEYAVFGAADMVWLGYRGHYTMSGVLVQAGMMGLPLVACKEGLIGWLTHEHRLGLPIAIDDVRAVVGAIKRLARDRGLSKDFGKNGRKASVEHKVENFARRICDELHLDQEKF